MDTHACNAAMHAGHADDYIEWLQPIRSAKMSAAACRKSHCCTGYQNIVKGVLLAAEVLVATRQPPHELCRQKRAQGRRPAVARQRRFVAI